MSRSFRRRALLAVAPALLAAGLSSAPAMAVPAQTGIDTGWVNYDGGCQARTTGTYYTSTNTITLKTDVRNPYWFVACRVRAQPIFDTNTGPYQDAASQYQMACAVLDPSCASTRYGSYQTWSPASPGLTQLKNTLQAWGINVDLGQIVTGIRIQHAPTTVASASSASKKSKRGEKLATPEQIKAKAKKFAKR